MFSGDNLTLKPTNYYGQAKNVALAYGWVTVNLIQRHLRLSYGFALSLVHGLEHRGVVGPIDATGRRLVFFDAEHGLDRAMEASKLVSPLEHGININLPIVNQRPLNYRHEQDEVEHDIALMPSQHRRDYHYSERCVGSQASEIMIFTRYFSGQSQHGRFEALVQCLRFNVNDPFEIKNATVVIKPENVRVTQLPTFSVVESGKSL